MAHRRDKRRKRDRRPVRKRSPAGDPRSQRRKAYQRLFHRLGLADAWRRLPRRCREHLYAYQPIDWQVRRTARARRHERAGELASVVEGVVHSPERGCPCDGEWGSFAEAVDLLLPLVRTVDEEPDVWDPCGGPPSWPTASTRSGHCLRITAMAGR